MYSAGFFSINPCGPKMQLFLYFICNALEVSILFIGVTYATTVISTSAYTLNIKQYK